MKKHNMIFAAAALALAGCTGHYGDYNRDPYGVTQEEASRDGYAVIGPMLAMQRAVVSTNVDRTELGEVLGGGAYGRYIAQTKDPLWANQYATFNAPDSWSKVMFEEVIPNLFPSYKELMNVTTENDLVRPVADIIKVAAMHRVTDIYGPIPYSKIGSSVQAPYDSQKDIYTQMFGELTAAVEALTARQTETINVNADNVYKGDLVRWIRLANSLKLRLAVRIAYADPALAQKMAEEAVGHQVGVMEANSDNAAITSSIFSDSRGNPIYVAASYNDGDERPSADMTAYMNAYGDGRMASYFNPSAFGGYVGYRCGISTAITSEFVKFSTFNISRDTPLQWMNAAEVAFLRSEGALRGWTMGGSAEEFYKKGVILSFEQWDAKGAAEYLANSTDYPTGYEDPTGRYTVSGLLTDVGVRWESDATVERNLERVIIQKWLATFPLGFEAWADRRRTGYPHFLPVVTNMSGGLVANDGTPRRMPYPASEAVTNGDNYRRAVTELLGGADNLATRVWWDCNPNSK